jgi:hypothetical protein
MECPGDKIARQLEDCTSNRSVGLTHLNIPLKFDIHVPMSDRKIKVGQVWKNNESGETFLVTRLFPEALATFAILRSTKDDTAKPLRVKVSRAADGMALPGYSPTQALEGP